MSEIRTREEIAVGDKWNLDKLFPDDSAWDKGFEELTALMPGIADFKGKLGRSAADLKACLDYMNQVELLGERLGYYAHLRVSEDVSNSASQGMFSRYLGLAGQLAAAGSYQTPEIQAIPDATMQQFLADPVLAEFTVVLQKILRFKPHVLSDREERLLAMQTESSQTPTRVFEALTNVDLDFGEVETPEGPRPLSQSTFSSFLLNPDKNIRETAYFQFYREFTRHQNTIAALYAGSVQQDIYKSKVRNYPSSRAHALFPDKIEESVYDNLVAVVHSHLPDLHRYYAIRRKALGLDELHHYDVYVPVVKNIQVRHSYNEAVEVIHTALAPLGDEYRDTLRAGLTGGWVDRYENKGKRSGAFSAGSFAGDPYILMNFKEDVFRDVFTLAHEGGHSMHSWYSARSNPFQHYSYAIFEAEVASTFNEQLLADYFMKQTTDTQMQAYLVSKQIDDVIATIFRQTMFAEFEHQCHADAESGKPLTVDYLRESYAALLSQYFGSDVILPECSSLEGLRIPHFYRAYYVYKYATGLAASIFLANLVLSGGKEEKEAYLSFLKSGGSRYPMESLALAGVDMTQPEPIENAMGKFNDLLDKLQSLQQ